MFKRFVTVLLCILLLFAAIFPIGASATVIEQGIITIGTVSGVTGDSVIVPISIEENPGISAITVSITYPSSELVFEKMLKGDFLGNAEVAAHPSRNIIRFVTSETGNKRNNGVLIYLKFKIADNAEAKFHKIGLKYNSGDFCNWKLHKIMPTIIPGGVNVAFNGNNCPHREYGEWSVSAKPSCDEEGLDSRTCKNCGSVDLKNTAPIGHEYSNDWTVDREATKDEDGLMSRHCIRCPDFVDQISFKYEEIDDGKIDNTIGEITENNQQILDIFKEQNPGKELSPNIPVTNSRPEDTSSSTSSKPTASKPTDSSSKDAASSTDETTSSNPSNQNSNLEQPPFENQDEKATYFEKITEAFPNFENIIDVFKVLLIILALVVIL